MQITAHRQHVHVEPRGRPSIITDDLVELVRKRIIENRRFIIRELSSLFPQISRSLLHKIFTGHLFRKLCARWVPKQLTPEHKATLMESALTFPQRYHDDTDEFLDRIIIGDGTWVAYITPEIEQQSMHCRHSGSRSKTKFKQTLLARKVMFLTKDKVNAECYCETLQKLRRPFRISGAGLTAGVVSLHDNTRSHMA